MSSLEGLNSLIQLESTRLEGAKQTTQNFQSVSSTVQQQGIQTAQSRMNMMVQRIDAEYTRECALADVRKLERKLARERAAESLAKNIACIATISNAVGNLGHLFNDLNGRQKLGDTPEYLKAPSLKPEGTKVSITQLPTGANTVYLSGQNKDGSETVYMYDTGKGGDTVSSMPMAATITEYDKDRILGGDYEALKKQTGKSSLSFDEIHQLRPELADKLVQTRGHGVTQDEAKNLVDLTDALIKPEKTSTARGTSYQGQQQGVQDAKTLAAVFAITNKDAIRNGDSSVNMDTYQIAEISNIAATTLTQAQKEAIFGKGVSDADIPKLLEDKNNQKKLFADPDFIKKLEYQATPNPSLASASDKFGKTGVTFTDNEISEMDKILSKDDKARIFGDANKDKNLAELLKDPNNVKALAADKVFASSVKSALVPKDTQYLIQKNENGNENVQYSDPKNGLYFQINDISADDKVKILGDSKYKNMSFNEIQSIIPNGQELARKLLAGVLEKDFDKFTPDKKAKINYDNLSSDQKTALSKDYPNVFKDGKFDANEFNKLDQPSKDKLQKEHPELFATPNLSALMGSEPSKAANIISGISNESNSKVTAKDKTTTKKISSLTQQQATDNVNRAGLAKNIDVSKQSLRDYLGKQGKIDDKGFIDHLKETGKYGMNFLVKTMEESAPYFQAYLKMKEQADKTFEELQAAIDKLNAASKKLRKLEMQIDVFSGRGS